MKMKKKTKIDKKARKQKIGFMGKRNFSLNEVFFCVLTQKTFL